MSLMDKPKTDFYKEYLSIKDFLFYVAFTQEETVSDVASWLLYNAFSKDVTSYEIDRHYRVSKGKIKYGADKNIERFFEQITFDGYHAYYAYVCFIRDKEDGIDGSHWKDSFINEDYYKLVYSNFYLNKAELYELDYIKGFNLNFDQASDYIYHTYSCDGIDATVKPEGGFSGMGWLPITLQQKKINLAKERDKDVLQPKLSLETLSKAIELIASMPNEIPQKEELTKTINEEVSSRSQDKKLIAMLAILLAQKSNVFQVGNRPNATQINEAIINLAQQELQVINDDMFGLKGNTAKISNAIKEYSHIIKNKPKDEL
jgi:hypothetical protein